MSQMDRATHMPIIQSTTSSKSATSAGPVCLSHLRTLVRLTPVDAFVCQQTVLANRSEEQPDPIGRPVSFVSGIFAGQTIRAELVEVQKADLGRKYARKDRRPLEPPPVIQLKLFCVYNEGAAVEKVVELTDYDDIIALGFVCHLDLFPVPEQDEDRIIVLPGQRQRQPRHRATLSTDTPTPSLSTIFARAPIPPASQAEDSGLVASSSVVRPSRPIPAIPSLLPSGPQPGLAHFLRNNSQPVLPSMQNFEDTVAILGCYPVTESSKRTVALVGATISHAGCYPFQGKPSLLFVFHDIASNLEGSFILRYRVSNILSEARGSCGMPVLAECYGGPFKVYASKEFPGLPPSTGLTNNLSMLGVPVHCRDSERRRSNNKKQLSE